MGWLKKIVKKTGNFLGDSLKTASYYVAAPVNSVTGHRYNPKYRSKFGRTLGVIGEKGIDNVHVLAKSYADGITGGLASKAANKFRPKNKRESFGNYLENRERITGFKKIDKATRVVSGFSQVLGNMYGGGSGELPAPQQSEYTQEPIVPTNDFVMLPY
jgi:hypothetical protein